MPFFKIILFLCGKDNIPIGFIANPLLSSRNKRRLVPTEMPLSLLKTQSLRLKSPFSEPEKGNLPVIPGKESNDS